MNSTATIGDLKLKVRERAREADIDGAMNKFYEWYADISTDVGVIIFFSKVTS